MAKKYADAQGKGASAYFCDWKVCAVDRYSWLRSLSQLGRGRILMPDTSPMAMNSVRVDEPP